MDAKIKDHAKAERQRRFKDRRRRGLVCITIEIDPATVGDALRAAGVLDACAEDDAEHLARALERLLANMAGDASPHGF
jgi:hypothetical protein